MRYITIFVLLFSVTVKAEEFLIEGTMVGFSVRDELLVKGCEKDCLALNKVRKHKKISLREVRRTLKFSGAVGSDVCHEVYKAGSLLGRSALSLDQRAFCYFTDGSMIEINSLSRYLRKNKIVQ